MEEIFCISVEKQYSYNAMTEVRMIVFISHVQYCD